MPAFVYFDDAGGGSPYTTLGDASKVNVTLSNGDLTATRAATGFALARSPHTKTAGKYYVEFTITDWSSAGDGVGVAELAASPGDVSFTGIKCSEIFLSGNIYSNGANTGKSLGSVADGNRIDAAFDFDNHRAWFRKNGGSWNNDGTANPATNTGGVTMSSNAMSPCIVFGNIATAANITANFGASAFVGTAPSGFTAGWPT